MIYPDIKVKLTGTDGNAFALRANVRRAMRRAGVPDTEINIMIEEATADDYDHLLRTLCKWVNVS